MGDNIRDTDIFKKEKKLLTCYTNVSNKFWEREKYFISLPYKERWNMPHQTASHLRKPNDEDL